MKRESREGLLRGLSGGGAANAASTTGVVIYSTFVAVCSSLAMGCASAYSSPAESGIMKDLGLSTGQYSVFGSMLTFGGMLGSIISGRVADLFGRRRTMWFLEIFFILGWFSIVLAKGAWWLDIGRFLLGFGVGIHNYVSAVYVTEITPTNVRGGFAMACQLMVCGGVALMFFIGNVIPWRILALIGTIPCLIQVVGVFFIPESPRWLAKVGREKELEATLQRLRGKDVDICQEAAEIKDCTEMFNQLSESRFLDLFQQKYANSLIVGVGIMLLVPLGGNNGVLYYASSIIEAAGGSVSFGTTAMALIQIPFSVVGVCLTDKSGRRPILMAGLAGTCLGSFLAGSGFLLQGRWKELTAPLVLTGILVYFAAFALGVAGLPAVIMSEIFPINIKGSAGSLAIFTNWFASWIVSFAFSFLLQWSSAGVFFIFAIICGSTILFVAKMVPETKGQTLEEIQVSMTQVLI